MLHSINTNITFDKLLTSNEHHTDPKYLLSVCVGGNISEADAGQTAEREVEGGYVLGLQRWTSMGLVQVGLIRMTG